MAEAGYLKPEWTAFDPAVTLAALAKFSDRDPRAGVLAGWLLGLHGWPGMSLLTSWCPH